jgi:hypothetical protein
MVATSLINYFVVLNYMLVSCGFEDFDLDFEQLSEIA